MKSKIIFCILALTLALTFLFFTKSPQLTQSPLFPSSPLLSQPTPTPFPFQELTIPYLRTRTYTSSLDVLELVDTNATYRTYTTSYDSDGLQINGLLTQPATDPPAGGWPAIVFVHGYIPPTEYKTRGQPYSAYVDYFARNGFVVFKIDLRGHDQSEGKSGGAYYSSDYVIDTLNAYAALQSSSFVNPKKIGLWGHSMAGNVTMRAFAAKPTIPAVVIWAGAGYTYEDLAKYRINDNSYRPPADYKERQRRRKLLADTYGEFSADSPFWKEVAVTDYLKDIKGALEIHHAVDDAVVNVGYSRDLMKLLAETAVPHQLFEYPSGGHNISDANFNLAMSRSVEFFKKYLK